MNMLLFTKCFVIIHKKFDYYIQDTAIVRSVMYNLIKVRLCRRSFFGSTCLSGTVFQSVNKKNNIKLVEISKILEVKSRFGVMGL